MVTSEMQLHFILIYFVFEKKLHANFFNKVIINYYQRNDENLMKIPWDIHRRLAWSLHVI